MMSKDKRVELRTIPKRKINRLEITPVYGPPKTLA